MKQSPQLTRGLVLPVRESPILAVAGDTLPGPGATAVFTATDKVGKGDSHRGAVAASLVESLRLEVAANRDFSIAAEEGRDFPTEEEWAKLFANA